MAYQTEVTNDDIEYFMALYMTLKRKMLNNMFIRPPKADKHKKFIEVIETIKQLRAIYVDFLQYAIRYYAPLRIFPTASHMLTEKFINNYRRHQAIKNRYIYDDYACDGDDIYIFNTGEWVSHKSDMMLPVDKDMRIKSIIFVATNGLPKNDLSKYWNDVNYAITKLKYLKKPIPIELLNLFNTIVKQRQK